MIIGSKDFDFNNNFYIMAILNMSSDSFYDGGKITCIDDALKKCDELMKHGADIIDVGGMSTKPGYKEISINQETENVCEVIRAIKQEFDIAVSVDTYRFQVAENAIKSGADMVNDIWGLKADNGQMAQLIASKKIPVCIMHNSKSIITSNIMNNIELGLDESLSIAKKYNINQDNIILDPGIGFAKIGDTNFTILSSLNKLKKKYNLPILLGISNKSFIGQALNLNIENRINSSIICGIYGILHGASILRVHNVFEHSQAIMLIKKIIKGGKDGQH